ncbi:DUF2076 domain-containing protein [Undibacterium sp. TJN19]|uniref:DUF2076 domain-containing protein n=1 Tax=Undibacterium sp. TJN19 TaxID=3413055 RepID=UPI003BF20F01
MSPQETQILQNFLDQLSKVQGIDKDLQAQHMITEAVSKQPDASYLLVQRALLLEQALATANSQIASLQANIRELQALNTPASGKAFLDPAISGWGNSASSRPLNVTNSVPVNNYAANPPPLPLGMPPIPSTASAPGFFSGHTGSMLGTVAATAAGVAAGAFLFQGLGHMMGNQDHAQVANNSAAQLNQGNGDLLPGYFDHDANTTPASLADAGADNGSDGLLDGLTDSDDVI